MNLMSRALDLYLQKGRVNSMAFRLFIDSDNGVTVTPEYDFKDGGRKIENRFRTRSADEFVYKWAEFDKVSFGVMHVDSEFKSIVNSYWSSNADLLWKDEDAVDVTSVHLVNKDKPISGFIKPYKDSFKGVIKLETY